MKLPQILTNVLPKKTETEQEIFLTCIFHPSTILTGIWKADANKQPEIIAYTSSAVELATWEQRKNVTLHDIDKLRSKENIEAVKVVLGLASSFLTKGGDIEQSVRKDLGKFLKELSLTPLGFVPIHQAIIYSLKIEEGIPPNVILLDTDKTHTHLYLYKVGHLSGETTIDVSPGIVPGVEKGLTGFEDIEVLPSRILLFGGDKNLLESYQSELLKYPWQTKANFLHFPKIEIYPSESVLASVSLAGASELQLFTPDTTQEKTEGNQTSLEKNKQNEEAKPAKNSDQSGIVEETASVEEGSNVEEVSPSELGFKVNKDVLEYPNGQKTKDSGKEDRETSGVTKKRRIIGFSLPKLYGLTIPRFGSLRIPIAKFPRTRAWFLIPVVVVFLALFIGLLYWFVPHAVVAIHVIPQEIIEEQAITIDPKATSLDPQAKIIPGIQQEKSITAEKTIPVTGKKKVGDSARGTVTIYNKTTSLRTFRKGAILSSGSLQFSLDNDIQVASASENLANSQLTYGKANNTITATAIGTESNMPANTEFTFKDFSTSIAIVRNEQPLTGGNSHDALVVTRADQDALVKILTSELTEKAKSELAGGLGLGDTLINETIITTVTQKKFSQELNEEASELTGSVTVNATGISYVTNDVLTFLKDLINSRVPPEYKLLEEETKSDVGNVKIAKGGKIITQASIHALAAPQINSQKIRNEAAGKSLAGFQESLKSLPGFGGVTLTFRYSPSRSRLPVNPANISVSVSVQK